MNLADLQRRVLAGSSKPLLLDAFPNAAAAYSLRLLRKGYTGNCIEVRRSSDNTTQNIGFVNGVLDTASLLSFVGAGNGFVRTWHDQSGNNRHLSQGATNIQPAIVLNGVLQSENLKNALLFNQKFLATESNVIINQPTTHFGVGRIDQSYSTNAIYIFSSSHVASSRQMFGYSSNKLFINAGNSLIGTQNQSSVQFVFSALFNGSNSLGRFNGSQFVSGNAGTQNNNGRIELGSQLTGQTRWLGIIQEFIIYPTNQSANFIGIEQNINSYYNIY